MSTINLQNVSKTYDNGVRALAGLNLDIRDGELLVLVGASGCGKTTLLRLIAGLEQPTTGSIHIGGRPMYGVPSWQRDLAMVFQKPALVPSKTVRRNLNFGNELRRGFLDWLPLAFRDQRRQENAAVEAIARLLNLEDVLDRKPGELSGGQLQRVALGRALLRRPAARLLDEPLGQLDGPLRRQLRLELHLLHRQFPATMVYVTHDSEEALALGDRIAVLNDGVLLQVDAAGTLLNRPRHRFVAEFFPTEVGPMSFLEGQLVEAVVQAARLHSGDAGEPPAPRIAFQIGERKLCPPASRRDIWQRNVGRRVVLGVRPDDVSIQCGGSSADDAWPMQVLLVEPWLHGTLVTCSDEAARVTGFVDAERAKEYAVGDAVSVGIRFERAWLFDGDSGVNLDREVADE